MKKLLYSIFAFVLAFALASCNPEPPEQPYVPAPGPTPPAPTLEDLHPNTIYNKTKGKFYDTLGDAVAELSAGNEIVFFKDEVVTEVQTIEVACTIDLNGHSITRPAAFSTSNDAVINVQGTATSHVPYVTIKNGTVMGAAYSKLSSGLLRFVNTDSAVIENVNVLGCVKKASATRSTSIYVAYGTLTINNSLTNTVTGRVIAYGNSSAANTKPTAVVINGGSFMTDVSSSDTYVICASNEKGPVSFTINGGDFIGDYESINSSFSKTDLTVNAATWDRDMTTWVAKTSAISCYNGIWIISDGSSQPVDPVGPPAPPAPPVRPSNNYDSRFPGQVYNETTFAAYSNLSTAISAAKEGDVLVMCKDETVTSPVRISKSITLDLNGHTIENTTAGQATVYVRSNPVNSMIGRVEILNGTIKGKPSGNGTNAVVTLVDCGVFWMRDVAVISNVDAGQTTPASALYINGAGYASLDNLTVVGKTIAYQRAINDASLCLVVNGGTFTRDPNSPEMNILRLVGDNDSTPGSVFVNGGSFDGIIEVAAGYPYPDLTITSGVWTMDVSAFVADSSSIRRRGNTWVVLSGR